MAVEVVMDEELEGLRGFPEIGREDLFRFFRLTSADLAFIDGAAADGLVTSLGRLAARARARPSRRP